jgi:hypothetical protein
MRLEYKHLDTYDETYFYTIYRTSFSHKYTEKFAIKVRISLFITVNDNTKQTIIGQKQEQTFACELHVHITERNYVVPYTSFSGKWTIASSSPLKWEMRN